MSKRFDDTVHPIHRAGASPTRAQLHYRGFLVAQDSHRGRTIWHVINPLQRGVGLFEGRGSKDAALGWVDEVYRQGKAEELLARKPAGGRGGLLADEPHPNRDVWLANAKRWEER